MARQAIRVRRHRWLLAIAASFALIAGACGGSDSKTSSTGSSGATAAGSSSSDNGKAVLGAAGTDAKGSAAIPADALFFASANIDQNSDAWKQLIATSSRFPGFAKISADFNAQLSKASSDGTTFAADIQPWLGGEVAVGVTAVDISNPNKPSAEWVLYAQSKDDAKATAALAKGAVPAADYGGYKTFTSKPDASGTPAFAAVGDGAVLISGSLVELQRAIDTRSGKAPSLASDAAFGATLAKLPSDNIAVAYLAGAKLAGLAKTAIAAASAQAAAAGGTAGATASMLPQLEQYSNALSKLQGVGMAFRAEDDGYRFETIVLGDISGLGALTGGLTEPYSPTLASRVPADAIAFLSFHDLGKAVQPILDQVLAANPSAKDQLTQAEGMLGLTIKDDVVPLLLGEHALWVGGPGEPIGVGLLLHPADAAAGAKTLKQITALAASGAGATVTDVPGGQQITIPGQSTPIFWRQVDDVLAISNNPTAGDKPAASLADSDAYKSALDAAGVKGDVTGLLWVNIAGAIQLAQTTGAQLTAEQAANTAPLRSVVYWGSQDGDTTKADIFVQVAK